MKLALIGVGLIGASAAMAMRRAGIIDRVSAFDLNAKSVRTALDTGLADEGAESIGEAVQSADCVLVAVPVRAMSAVFAEVGRHVRDGAYITDVGSTRVSVMTAAREGLGRHWANYVAVHPIAGGELPGIEHADCDLFVGAKAVVTDHEGTVPAALEFWEAAWKATGAEIVHMTPEEHDAIFARVSHLPHLLSFTMVDSLLHDAAAEKSLAFAGSGFRDFTRIAASSPVMWTDISLANRGAILNALADFESDLAQLKRHILENDAQALTDMFARASAARRACFPKPRASELCNGQMIDRRKK